MCDAAQLEEERLAEVERDNRILLTKMSGIMRSKGQVDHINDYEHKRCGPRGNIFCMQITPQPEQGPPAARVAAGDVGKPVDPQAHPIQTAVVRPLRMGLLCVMTISC